MICPKLVIATAAVVAISGWPAQADDCANAKTQSTMSICADLEYQQADAVMNEMYQRAIEAARSAGQDHEERVRQAQRAWIPFRDLTCEAEGAQRQGGSMQGMVISICLTRVTRARIEDLKQYLEM